MTNYAKRKLAEQRREQITQLVTDAGERGLSAPEIAAALGIQRAKSGGFTVIAAAISRINLELLQERASWRIRPEQRKNEETARFKMFYRLAEVVRA